MVLRWLQRRKGDFTGGILQQHFWWFSPMKLTTWGLTGIVNKMLGFKQGKREFNIWIDDSQWKWCYVAGSEWFCWSVAWLNIISASSEAPDLEMVERGNRLPCFWTDWMNLLEDLIDGDGLGAFEVHAQWMWSGEAISLYHYKSPAFVRERLWTIHATSLKQDEGLQILAVDSCWTLEWNVSTPNSDPSNKMASGFIRLANEGFRCLFGIINPYSALVCYMISCIYIYIII